jgi:hypothetical protein
LDLARQSFKMTFTPIHPSFLFIFAPKNLAITF